MTQAWTHHVLFSCFMYSSEIETKKWFLKTVFLQLERQTKCREMQAAFLVLNLDCQALKINKL
jgi:hypothetical protein